MSGGGTVLSADVLVGATACGKSAVALVLAAKALGFTEATDKPEASADAAKTAAKEK